MTTLQAIDARLTKYRALIDELTALRAEVSDALPKVETFDAPVKAAPPGNSKPVARQMSAPRATGASKGRPSMLDDRRKAVAELLAVQPLSSSEIIARINMPTSAIAAVLNHPWFQKGPEHRSPWELTDAGRSAVTAASPV